MLKDKKAGILKPSQEHKSVMEKVKFTSARNDLSMLIPLLIPASVLIGALIISFAVYFSFRGANFNFGITGKNAQVSVTAAAVAGADTAATPGKTSISDNAYLGDKSTAKVAIVEFSDYECPFCKRHFQETYQPIIDNYVKTGKAILVFRNFPLSFHDPLATKEALAAQCVQGLGDNSKYFVFHDLVYSNTTSNGTGLAESKLYDYAVQAGIDKDAFTKCFTEERYKDKIAQDIKDGTAAGINGTPGFIIGLLGKDGSVDGVNIAGALPYADFQSAIDAQLAR